MINVLFCCLGGASSSAMVSHFEKQIQEYHMEDELKFTFCAFRHSATCFEKYDIIVCCPHQFHEVRRHNQRYIKDKIPIYVLPVRMYGPVDVKELYYDLLDIMEIFRKNPHNPVHFPGEENCFNTWRTKAFRNTPVPVLNPYIQLKTHEESTSF
jgi:PTS system cellobiose-specific IIB component